MFDAQKSFEENLEAFKAACEGIDADCAKILFDNIAILIKHGADRDARTLFNKEVKKALDALPTKEEAE
ncbi:hypothetical protein [Gluconobacter sp. P1D12_c]|uniref:hypothetical protein n=1 Tax=Gluconobacter sp. P1D12_c TaxID=2762614 RepID=UPI001C045B9D|nr:hypothetical protein [Gluconobacter sp. P1D12_c]